MSTQPQPSPTPTAPPPPVTPAAASTATPNPSAFAPAGAPPPDAFAPAGSPPAAHQPSVETGDDYGGVSSYEPQLKKGRHVLLAEVLDFAPGKSQDTQEYYGWSLTLALKEDAPDEVGGKIAAGTRLRPMAIYTTQGQFDKDASTGKARAKNALIAFNNIPQNTRSKESVDKASAALMALPPEKRLPGPRDENPAHFEQWKGTVVKAVISVKDSDDGTRTRLLELQAKDTPSK